MSKKTVAVIFGGFSPEYEVSLNSAYSVIKAISKDKYNILMLGITNKGSWYKFSGSVEDLPGDNWHKDKNQLSKAFISPDRGGGILVYENGLPEKVHVDVVFPVLHGRNGEDGTIQGLCELSGIPVVGSGSAASSLCMDKERSHQIVSILGISVPKSVSFEYVPGEDELLTAVKSLSLPVFVKPIKAGSSIGVSKINNLADIPAAVKEAFIYDDAVIIEENIDGKEVGCSVIGNHDLQTGRINEIEVSDGFFNYQEKYTLKTSKIHTPGRIDAESERRLQEAGKKIFKALGCRGYARIDLFLKENGEIVFSEANTIPGFTAHSQLPKMMKAAGIDYPELVDILLDLALQAPRGEWYG
ncbi:MAG: D-alanine--D-alanine ligase [Oscillospiraceae bacterium]|nr:D-alanine--D-alanine ligase [Oscillospiraceae bacterium]